jgi:putative acetyltransferase
MTTAQDREIQIRETAEADLPDILRIQRLAFGQDDEAALTDALLHDPSANPVLSLMAFKGDNPVGHILFSRARLAEPDSALSIAILAPLAVVPEVQRQGIGGRLVEAGLRCLSETGVDLVFVLGHPGYYPRHGFEPACRFGLEPPYLIPDEHSDAWMVHAPLQQVLGSVRGTVVCSDVLNRPEYWRE